MEIQILTCNNINVLSHLSYLFIDFPVLQATMTNLPLNHPMNYEKYFILYCRGSLINLHT